MFVSLSVDENTVAYWYFSARSTTKVRDVLNRHNGDVIFEDDKAPVQPSFIKNFSILSTGSTVLTVPETVTSSNISETITQGKFGETRNFNGKSYFIKIPNNNELKLTNFTIEALVNFIEIYDRKSTLISKMHYNGTSYTGYEIYFKDDGVYIVLAKSSLSLPEPIFVPFELQEARWFYFAISIQEDGVVNVYVDGKHIKTTGSGVRSIFNDADILLGARYDQGLAGYSHYLKGSIEFIRLSQIIRKKEEFTSNAVRLPISLSC